MKENKLLGVGIAGTILMALCCFTPLLVVLLGAVGLSAWLGWLGWLDYVLLPALRQAKYIDLLPAYPLVIYLQGEARFTPQGLALNGAPLPARKIIVASGSHARAPSIPGIEDVAWLSSTTALELRNVPGSLLVIGGGYIGCELAQVFARAGCAVTIMCRSRLLPQAEPEISAALAGYFADEGITVLSGVAYERISQGEGRVTVNFSAAGGGAAVSAEKVLVSAGRAANTQALAARHTRGLIKLIADAATMQLLGAHLLAPQAADSVQTAAVAIKVGMTSTQLGEMIFPYLTTVEGLKLAAQTFDKDVAKLSCCAG